MTTNIKKRKRVRKDLTSNKANLAKKKELEQRVLRFVSLNGEDW